MPPSSSSFSALSSSLPEQHQISSSRLAARKMRMCEATDNFSLSPLISSTTNSGRPMLWPPHVVISTLQGAPLVTIAACQLG